jgi:hypothetical protein
VVRALDAVRRAFERVRAALRAAVFRWRLAAALFARALRCVPVVVRLALPLRLVVLRLVVLRLPVLRLLVLRPVLRRLLLVLRRLLVL